MPSKPWGFPSFPHSKSSVKSGPGHRQTAVSLKAAQLRYSHMVTGAHHGTGSRTRCVQRESVSRCSLFPGSQDFRPLDHAVSGITKLLLSWPEVRGCTGFSAVLVAGGNWYGASMSSAPYLAQGLPKASSKLRDQRQNPKNHSWVARSEYRNRATAEQSLPGPNIAPATF